jgi:hypothetical protein
MSKPGSIKPQPSLSSWWKHLRRLGKRAAAKMDRAAVKGALRKDQTR